MLRRILKLLGGFLLIVLLTALAAVLNALGACAVLAYGPSPEWQRRFVATFDETSAMKFVPRIYLSEETVQSLLHPEPAGPEEDPFTELAFEAGAPEADKETGPTVVVADPPEEGEEWLEIIDIKCPTYQGKMMVIHDPSRVIVGTLEAYGESCQGMYLADFIESYGAIGGTNAGGFEDDNGTGTGGIPDGLVIRNGEIAWGSPAGWYYNVIGFDAEHILHVGSMYGQGALDLGLTSAVSFYAGPILIQNGKPRTNLGGGLNPRTCIGQTADGTVLLLVLEGRRPDSLGATYDDLVQLMVEFGAVNAANLDGGSSSEMCYNGESIIRNSSYFGGRRLPNAILILSGENSNG